MSALQDFIESPGGDALDLSRPSKDALVYLLRHRELWPKRFAWYFRDPWCCAMGLAWRAWPAEIDEPSVRSVAAALGISTHDARRIFQLGDPTAAQVADKLAAL